MEADPLSEPADQSRLQPELGERTAGGREADVDRGGEHEAEVLERCHDRLDLERGGAVHLS